VKSTARRHDAHEINTLAAGLGDARRPGLVKLGHAALDGTKIKTNASS
jgi:hypothetical protein